MNCLARCSGWRFARCLSCSGGPCWWWSCSIGFDKEPGTVVSSSARGSRSSTDCDATRSKGRHLADLKREGRAGRRQTQGPGKHQDRQTARTGRLPCASQRALTGRLVCVAPDHGLAVAPALPVGPYALRFDPRTIAVASISHASPPPTLSSAPWPAMR